MFSITLSNDILAIVDRNSLIPISKILKIGLSEFSVRQIHVDCIQKNKDQVFH